MDSSFFPRIVEFCLKKCEECSAEMPKVKKQILTLEGSVRTEWYNQHGETLGVQMGEAPSTILILIGEVCRL